MTQLWHSFLALPFVVHIAAWTVLGLAALFALIKSRALQGVWGWTSNLFWGWLSRHVSSRPRLTTRIDLRMVAGSPIHCNWSVGNAPLGKEPIMLLLFTMNFAHVENVNAILKRAYLKGTSEAFPMNEIVVEGPYEDEESRCIGVRPVRTKTGKNLKGRIVFVDQFNGKHVSEKITFYPNVIPPELRTKQLTTHPNCVFCNQPVQFSDQAPEAQMTAHITCIWS